MMIRNTATFMRALHKGKVDEAEVWLTRVKGNRDLYRHISDDKVMDCETQLMHALCGKRMFARVKGVIESSLLEESKGERRKRLAEVAGRHYDLI